MPVKEVGRREGKSREGARGAELPRTHEGIGWPVVVKTKGAICGLVTGSDGVMKTRGAVREPVKGLGEAVKAKRKGRRPLSMKQRRSV